MRKGITIALPHTTVACIDGAVVGVMECGRQDPIELTLSHFPTILRAVRIIGPSLLPRAIRGFYLRRRVSFDHVPDAFGIAELYVDERRRNQGIGGRMLLAAEQTAAARGVSRMCLETGIDNPARRLYARSGYLVTATKADRDYERLSGSPGRVLMMKELRASGDTVGAANR